MEKPKFQFAKVDSKITWLGLPLYGDGDPSCPASLNTRRYEELVQDYRISPSAQLNLLDPANDLRNRVGTQVRLDGHPLIPVAMTSKL
eukprot:5326120-Amphidinium_carterae.1